METGYEYVPQIVCAFALLTPEFRLRVYEQKIENLEALVNLEELWLGKNKISKLEVSIQFAFVRILQ